MFGLNQGSIYSILTIIFLSYYTRQKVYPILIKIYNDINFFRLFSLLMSSQEMNVILEEDEKKPEDNTVTITDVPEKYEDKFLDAIRKMNNEFIFDEKEQELESNKFDEFLSLAQEEHKKKVIDIKDKISSIEREIEIQKSGDDFFNVKYSENNTDDETSSEDSLNKNAIKSMTEERLALENLLVKLESNNEINIDNLHLKARKFVIDERLDKLKNSFIMEKTPLGNVLMLYNNKRGSFEYYSDNTIPYRYLETVSRKYVKTFGCRPIYCDMEEELKNYEKKLEEKEREKEEKQELEKRILEEKRILDEKNMSVTVVAEPKKNVFAKFKSYNKEAGTGHVNIAAPPKNSIPNNKVTESVSDEKVLLKENANRYSYEGKLSNFNFLKKVDRKIVDKKYAMTFADFKRLQEEKKTKK
jgi:hypothetical protein